MVYIGKMIRVARHSKQMRLEDVADRVGVTPGALSHIESGRRLPSAQVALAIANVLGIEEQLMLEALDDAHSVRRRSSVTPGTMQGESYERPAARFTQRPIEELLGMPEAAPSFSAVQPMAEAATEPSRYTARFSDHTGERLAALEQLADTASDAIRTLRGLVADEDPLVSREALRLLRELDVRLPEE